jgi:alpha-mannosidase
VFSYALTNYWSSKWAGRKVGDFDYHYAITSAPTFDPAPLTRFGYEQRNPLEVSEVKDSDKLETQKGPLPADRGSLATVAPASVIVTAVKGAEDGEGLVFRLMEIAGRDARGTLTLPWTTVGSAARATSVETPGAPLEHDAHTISFGLKPHEVLTVRVR